MDFFIQHGKLSRNNLIIKCQLRIKFDTPDDKLNRKRFIDKLKSKFGQLLTMVIMLPVWLFAL